ncbi:MAG: hypothetical protein HPY71_07890 [Firmicutes bacterium]|nr:hypothetical protein [Bacillota bacterium]
MSFIGALILRRDLPTVTAALGRRASLHIIEISEIRDIYPGGLADRLTDLVKDKEPLARLSGLEKRLASIQGEFDAAPLSLPAAVAQTGRRSRESHIHLGGGPVDLDPVRVAGDAAAILDREIEPAVGAVTGRVSVLKARRERNESLRRQLAGIQSLDIDLGGLRDLEFVYVTIGHVPRANLARLEESLREMPSVIVPYSFTRDEVFIAAATLRHLEARLRAALKGAYFKPVELGEELSGTPRDALRRLEEDALGLDGVLKQEMKNLAALGERWGKTIQNLLDRVRFNGSVLEFYTHFGGTEQTALISGFVPSDEAEPVKRDLEEATAGRLVFEARAIPPGAGTSGTGITPGGTFNGRKRPSPLVAPTLLRNPGFLRPFEGLTITYGRPRYGELDPTMLLALTYVFMFGFMFGDLGQGLVIVALGALLALRPPGALRQFSGASSFLLLCGLSASIFGLLYGSAFGREGLIPAIWERPIENISSFLVVGVLYGIFQNTAGLVIYFINNLRQGRVCEAVLGEFGLASSAFYFSLLGAAYSALVPRSAAGVRAGLLIAAASLVVLIFREPIMRWVTYEGPPAGTGRIEQDGWVEPGAGAGCASGSGPGESTGLLASLLGVFDIVLRHLTNSISFVRLPAFAIAHVALGIAIYTVAGSISGLPGGRLLSAVAIVLGNAGVIALEGMIVGIQCLRLEFYEFFSKFLSGDGVPYDPWRLGFKIREE